MNTETQPASRKLLPLPEFTSFRFRDYRLWWVGSAAVMLNMFTTQMTMAWWVLGESDSPALVGTVIFAFGLPSLLFTIPAGAIADWWDRRKQLLIAQSPALATSLTFAFLTLFEVTTIPLAILFSFLLGTTVAFSQPPRQALIPMLIPRHLLLNGVVLGNLSQTISQMAGPAIAGGLIATLGVAAAFFFLAGLQLLGVTSLSFMRIPDFPTEVGPSGRPLQEQTSHQVPGGASDFLKKLAGGLIHIWEHKPLLVLLVLYTAVGFWVGGAIQALVPVLIRDIYGMGAPAVGLAFTVQSTTGLIVGLYLTRLGKMKNKGGFFALSMMLGSFSLAAYSVAPRYSVALIFFATFGIAAAVYGNMSQTILQTHTPRHLMGRVLSVYALFSQGFLPLGALQAGVIAGLIGVRFSSLYGAIICLMLATFALLFAREFRRLG